MIIVLLGAPKSGKTTILKELQKKGFKVFHADSFINKEYQKGMKGYEIIKENFGDSFVTDKSVDRDKIKEEIFNDPDFILRLNELIHPLIKKHLEKKDNFIAELPIISSTPIKFNYDKLILVKASNEAIKKRLSSTTNEFFLNYIIKKWNQPFKFDYVIDTTNGFKINKIILKLNEMGLKNEN